MFSLPYIAFVSFTLPSSCGSFSPSFCVFRVCCKTKSTQIYWMHLLFHCFFQSIFSCWVEQDKKKISFRRMCFHDNDVCGVCGYHPSCKFSPPLSAPPPPPLSPPREDHVTACMFYFHYLSVYPLIEIKDCPVLKQKFDFKTSA